MSKKYITPYPVIYNIKTYNIRLSMQKYMDFYTDYLLNKIDRIYSFPTLGNDKFDRNHTFPTLGNDNFVRFYTTENNKLTINN